MVNAGVVTRTTPDRLTAAWNGSIAAFGAPTEAIASGLAELASRYREPHRRYHTLDHLDEVLVAVESLIDDADDPTVVRLAACYHDAVHDPRSATNESDSARLATAQLSALGVPGPMLRAIARLVLMTSDHQALADADEAVLADADLWILGAPSERYRRYAVDVRAEYAHVDDDGWRTGRAAVLDGFLGRDHIYASARFRTDFEAAARDNLADERENL